jgi:excisionase family DNA binding protein
MNQDIGTYSLGESVAPGSMAGTKARKAGEGARVSNGDILTKRDLADLLQVSERTVERWMSEGSIPYVPLPKRGAWSEARFLRSEIVEWMRKRTVKPIRVPQGVVNAQTA